MTAQAQRRDYLSTLSPGVIPFDQLEPAEDLLANCWRFLAGSRDGGMAAFKLHGRTEELTWIPPMIGFEIERQGAFMNGSTRAEIEQWQVDLDRGIATIVGTRKRQIRKAVPRLDVKPIAAEIAALIGEGEEDARINWRGTSRVWIVVSEIIPTTVTQTTTSRRRCLAAELKRLPGPLGWRRKDAGSHLVFERALPR